MKFNKLDFTPCGTKIISRVLLLSFGFSLFFDAALLKALDDAKANRNTVLGYISGPVNSTILNPANTMLTGATHDLWLGVWGNLKARLDDGNLTPSDVVAPASSKYFTTRSFSGDYNGFYPTKSANLGDDAKQSMLLALLFNGSNPSHDGTPPTTFPSGDSRLIANFYHPSSTYFASTDLNTNVSAGGLLIKNKNFCDALDTTYGKGIWSGATCTVDANCCADKDGVQQSCLFNSDTAALVPAFPDSVTAALVNYGVCATPVPTCGTKINDPCLSVGLKAGCCNGDNLICAGTGTGAKCLSNTGGYCDHKTDCAVSGSACVDNICAIPPSDPSAPTCKGFGLDVGCQANPVDPKNACCAKDVNGNATNFTCDNGSCLGNKGFACSSNRDCTTGLICTDVVTDVLVGTISKQCQQDPGVPHDIASGSSCTPGGEGCADDDHLCAIGSDGVNTVCCIDSDLNKDGDCTKDSDCCNKFRCTNLLDIVSEDKPGSCTDATNDTIDKTLEGLAAVVGLAGLGATVAFRKQLADALKSGITIYKNRKAIRLAVELNNKAVDVTTFISTVESLDIAGKAVFAKSMGKNPTYLDDLLASAKTTAAQVQANNVALVMAEDGKGGYAVRRATNAEITDAMRAASQTAQEAPSPIESPAVTRAMSELYDSKVASSKVAMGFNNQDFSAAKNSTDKQSRMRELMALEMAKSGKDVLAAAKQVAQDLGVTDAATLTIEDLRPVIDNGISGVVPDGVTDAKVYANLGDRTIAQVEQYRTVKNPVMSFAQAAMEFRAELAKTMIAEQLDAIMPKPSASWSERPVTRVATADMHPL